MQRRAIVAAMVAAAAILAFGIGAASLDGALGQSSPILEGDTDSPTVPSGGKSSEAGSTNPSCTGCGVEFVPSLALAGALPAIPGAVVLVLGGVGVVVLLLVWFRASGGTVASLADVGRTDDGVETAADHAGASRTTIDEPAASNPVYRAWREMVDRIDAERDDDRDPSTTTPGEYADAARKRGWNHGAIDTLTDCFQRVRYGDVAVTDERTDRARQASTELSDDES